MEIIHLGKYGRGRGREGGRPRDAKLGGLHGDDNDKDDKDCRNSEEDIEDHEVVLPFVGARSRDKPRGVPWKDEG